MIKKLSLFINAFADCKSLRVSIIINDMGDVIKLFKYSLLTIVCLLLLSSCSSSRSYAPVSQQGAKIKSGTSSYIVTRGDTLYSIAWRAGRDYKDLAKWNHIKYPYTIYVGQKLRLFAKKNVNTINNKKCK